MRLIIKNMFSITDSLLRIQIYAENLNISKNEVSRWFCYNHTYCNTQIMKSKRE